MSKNKVFDWYTTFSLSHFCSWNSKLFFPLKKIFKESFMFIFINFVISQYFFKSIFADFNLILCWFNNFLLFVHFLKKFFQHLLYNVIIYKFHKQWINNNNIINEMLTIWLCEIHFLISYLFIFDVISCESHFLNRCHNVSLMIYLWHNVKCLFLQSSWKNDGLHFNI